MLTTMWLLAFSALSSTPLVSPSRYCTIPSRSVHRLLNAEEAQYAFERLPAIVKVGARQVAIPRDVGEGAEVLVPVVGARIKRPGYASTKFAPAVRKCALGFADEEGARLGVCARVVDKARHMDEGHGEVIAHLFAVAKDSLSLIAASKT
jgi:hypothetical protein